MGTRDPRVDAYIAKAQPFAKPILEHLRAVVHEACPEANETIKWSFPNFEHKGMLCSMASFKAHCAFGFWNKDVVGDAAADDAMGDLGRIESLKDLPSKRVLATWIKHAAKLNAAGIKPPRAKPEPKPPPRVPPELAAALARNKQARAHFEAFSPSHRREYIDWITEAKREETRARRIETALEWIANGKSRNWKYQSK